jgi:hypothetical protein
MQMADPAIIAHSDQLDQLATALAKAQAEIVGAKKDSANPFFKSDYADLASVWMACRKPLTANGLAVVQMPIMEAGAVAVSTLLLHASGQWVRSTLHANPKDLGPQAVGSVITYLRRYALASMAGVPQIDDDAEAGEARPAAGKRDITTGQPKPSAGGSLISEAQQKRLWARAKAKDWTREQVQELFVKCHIEHTADIKAADYDDIIAALDGGPQVAT